MIFHVKYQIDSQEGIRGLLNNFQKLKKIHLSRISSIDESSFSHLVNLEFLELDGCYLDFLPLDPDYMKSNISCNAIFHSHTLG